MAPSFTPYTATALADEDGIRRKRDLREWLRANSSDVTFSKPSTQYRQASYFGDANSAATTSVCTDEQLVIAALR